VVLENRLASRAILSYSVSLSKTDGSFSEDGLLTTCVTVNQHHPWYALKVRTRSEVFVGECLSHKSFQTFVPTFQEARTYSDRIKKVESALFPGYIFCRLDVEHRLPILTTPGVEYIITQESIPQPIPEKEIEGIRRVVEDGKAKPWPYLKTGDRVRVKAGSFAGVEGLLVSEKGTDRLVLSVSLLQRSVAVEMDRLWVQPA
jgi:transcription antitermination factor NusG